MKLSMLRNLVVVGMGAALLAACDHNDNNRNTPEPEPEPCTIGYTYYIEDIFPNGEKVISDGIETNDIGTGIAYRAGKEYLKYANGSVYGLNNNMYKNGPLIKILDNDINSDTYGTEDYGYIYNNDYVSSFKSEMNDQSLISSSSNLQIYYHIDEEKYIRSNQSKN